MGERERGGVRLGADLRTPPATGVVKALTVTFQMGATRFPMQTMLMGIWSLRTVGVSLLVVPWGCGGCGNQEVQR